MNRNPRRYNRSNPPSTQSEAQVRSDELTTEITRMETQLDHADPDTYPSDEAYASWRQRTIDALAHRKNEQSFLEDWLDSEQSAQATFVENIGLTQPRGQRQPKVQLADVSLSIRRRAAFLAAEHGRKYTPRFSTDAPPRDLAQAHARTGELNDTKKSLEEAFTELTAAWTSHPLRRSDLTVIKAPLQKILTQVEREIGVVKAFVRVQSIGRVEPIGLKTICVQALARAVTEGFALSQEERGALAILQSRMAL